MIGSKIRQGNRFTAPFRGGLRKDKTMQKPNSIFDMKPKISVPSAGKTEPVPGPARAPALHADKRDADTHAKQTKKK